MCLTETPSSAHRALKSRGVGEKPTLRCVRPDRRHPHNLHQNSPEPEVKNKLPVKTRRHTRNLASLLAGVVLVLATLWGGGTDKARPLTIAISDSGLEAALR